MKGIGRYGRCLDLYTSESELIARLNATPNVVEKEYLIGRFLDTCMDELDVASRAAERDDGYIDQLGNRIKKYNKIIEPYREIVKRGISSGMLSLTSKLDGIEKKRGQK
jgi:hypothetical protein